MPKESSTDQQRQHEVSAFDIDDDQPLLSAPIAILKNNEEEKAVVELTVEGDGIARQLFAEEIDGDNDKQPV